MHSVLAYTAPMRILFGLCLLSIIAAAGCKRVTQSRPPTIAVLSTGPCDLDATGDPSDPYGAPGATILRPFQGANRHKGIDVGQARGVPVFANLRASIPIAELNRAHHVAVRPDNDLFGLQVAAVSGDAQLIGARVIVQPWSPRKSPTGNDYGGVLGLAAHYQYLGDDGAKHVFTMYIEYEHLITVDYLPRRSDGTFIDNDNVAIAPGEYSGCTGFGARMQHDAVLTAGDLEQRPLIGFLGAMQASHVHIQAAFGNGTAGYLRNYFVDPGLVLIGR